MMGIFGKSNKPEPVPLSRIERVRAHQRQAEDLLARSAKAGRAEAETRWATLATAHATLAISYLLSVDDGPTNGATPGTLGSQMASEPPGDTRTVQRTSSDRGLYDEHRAT
jgi:hypothetical protein